MDRSAVWAAALLLLLATGSTSATSERELLAHKPSGGALHGVAVVGALNYFITNGNGARAQRAARPRARRVKRARRCT